jgi:uncharacterized protein (TIGR04141 family)
MSKAKSRCFSIYLLKPGYDASNALKGDHTLDNEVVASRLPAGASLFVLDSVPREPWWKAYFGLDKKLTQSSKGALVFLPAGQRCFALSFGHVFHNLKDASYEYDFGLRVTLNSVDPTKLKSTDILEPGAARRQRTQVPMDSDLTYFDFDRDSTILKSLTGKVKDEHKKLFKHATGASNLHLSTDVAPGGLVALCEKLLELYGSDVYKTTFPDIQHITPVRDPSAIAELNWKLLDAFRAKSEDLYLTVPDLIDYRDNVCAVFTGAGPSLIYDDVYMGRYYEYLAENGEDLAKIGIDDLKQHSLQLTDEEGMPRDRYSVMKCLIYDTTLDQEGETYHLCEGCWYKVETSYVAKLQAFLDPMWADLNLPSYSHDSEGAYNEAVAKADGAFVCLDKTDISPAGQTQIEPCDLYTVNDGHAALYHIKVSTFSAHLSHLFNQGINAIELLKLETSARESLKTLVQDRAAPGTADVFLAPLKDEKYHVVFGIVTHKDKLKKSLNLPLFSRISLMRNLKELQLMSVRANFGFIADQSPKSAGKKKQRKKKGEIAETVEELEHV